MYPLGLTPACVMESPKKITFFFLGKPAERKAIAPSTRNIVESRFMTGNFFVDSQYMEKSAGLQAQ
jgi:hypothetical protein